MNKQLTTHSAWPMTINVIEQGPSMCIGLLHTKFGQQMPTTHIYKHQMGQSVEDFSMQVLEPTEHL